MVLHQPGLDSARANDFLNLDRGAGGSRERRTDQKEEAKLQRAAHRIGPPVTGVVLAAAAASSGALVPCSGSSQPVAAMPLSPNRSRTAPFTSAKVTDAILSGQFSISST